MKQKSEKVNKSYRWDARDYRSHSTVQQKWAQELIEELGLVGKESLLDIGCGDGKNTSTLASHLRFGRVVGIDSSKEMIKLAVNNYVTDSQPNLTFQLMDAGNLRFQNEFDIIFSNAALHWVLDHQPVLKGMYRSLKAGGRILVQMGGKGNAKEVIDVFEKIISVEPWAHYFQGFDFPYGFYSPQEYKPWLQRAGLDVERLDLVPKEMIHQNGEQFKGWVRTTWLPYLERVPVEMRSALIDELAGKYFKATGQSENGPVTTAMMRLEYSAKKKTNHP